MRKSVIIIIILTLVLFFAGAVSAVIVGDEQAHTSARDRWEGYSFSLKADTAVCIDLFYNDSVVGTITNFKLRVFNGNTAPLASWFRLYINGQHAGFADNSYYFTNSSSDEAANGTCRFLEWENIGIPINADNIVFEVYKGIGYGTGSTTWVTYAYLYGRADGQNPDDLPITREDSDGDGLIDNTKISSAQPNGVWDGSNTSFYDIGYTGAIYEFTYSAGGGGGGGTNYSYSDHIYVTPDAATIYNPVILDYFFNSTAYINHFTIETGGAEVYNESIETPNGNRIYTPTATGIYYVNNTRNGNQTAASTFTASGSSNIYIYPNINPLITGNTVTFTAKNSVYTDYPTSIRIYTYSNGVEGASPVFNQIVNATAATTATWKPTTEGAYIVKLMLDKTYDDDENLDSFMFYVKNKDYTNTFNVVDSVFSLDKTNTIQYQHNFAGSSGIRMYFYSGLKNDFLYEPQYVVGDVYRGSVTWKPEQYIGAHQIRLYYTYGDVLLCWYNVTVTQAGATTGGITPIFEDFDSLWAEWAAFLGFETETFKLVVGLGLTAFFTLLPLIYVIKVERKGVTEGFRGMEAMLRPTSSASSGLAGNAFVYYIFMLIGALIAYAIGLFPIWVFMLMAILIIILGALKFSSKPEV
jgi:hypothetical protein